MLQYREDWRPTAYGLGELLHSMSLLPNEEVTLELKTWETDTRLEEQATDIEERNLSDNKGTTSAASEASNSLQTKERTYVDAKASYSGFGFSASVSAGWSKDTATAHSNIAKQARSNTTQATNEMRANRKVKIALSRETGSESKTTRRMKNINQAYTLNANFYEVLREYEVSLDLIDVDLVLLGDAVPLNQPAWLYDSAVGAAKGQYALVGWKTAGGELDFDQSKRLTWGHVLNGMRRAGWVAEFTDVYGFSPALVLYRAWSKNLYDGGLSTKPGVALSPDLAAFQQNMLRFVQPTSGWAEPDESGLVRWAFQITPESEDEALTYLYRFIPYQFSQLVYLYLANGQSQTDATAQATKAFIAGLQPDELVEAPSLVRVPGPFEEVSTEDFESTHLPEWVAGIVQELEVARALVGRVKVDDADSYKVTLPTNGTHADLSLGLCSGAEDYYEIQRQFDLEEHRLEIEKLRLEIEKLQLDNAARANGEPNVLIKNPPATTSLSVSVQPKGDEALAIAVED